MLPTGNLKVLWEWSEWLAWAINVVDCQYAFAGKPAPTGIEYICKSQVGWQAASAWASPFNYRGWHSLLLFTTQQAER